MRELDLLALMESTQNIERKISLALMYCGLRLPQYRLLNLLDKSGKIALSDISRRLEVSCATMSVLISKMKEAGLVECQDNARDKRSFYVQLTEAGRSRLASAEQTVHVIQRRISKSLPDEIVQTVNAFSREIANGRIIAKI